jgi:indolepyruvate ferredoxin oxidoreductase
MFTLLAALRRIRSTPLDVFSFAKIRREERRLLDLYRSDLELVRTLLTAENYCECEQLLGLPGLVRGFESVKRASIRKYYESRERSLASLNKN